MGQFYAEIKGNRGGASRMGSKTSGISGHLRGWAVGARVDIMHIDGADVVRVYRTSGSNGGEDDKLIAEFQESE